MKHSLSLPAFLLVMSLAGAASADYNDFDIRAEIGLPSTPGRLAVTPDDRFVLILQDDQTISVLDTWNFSLVGGSIALSATATPVAIAISPAGDKAYVTLSNGIVDVVDISALADLVLDDSLTALSPQPAVSDTVKISSNALGDIAIVPMSGSTPADNCVFVIDGDSLKWFQEDSPSTTIANFPIGNCLAREVEGAGKYAHVLCDDEAAGVNATLQQIECTSTGPLDVTVSPLILGSDGDIRSLSLAQNQEWLVVGEISTESILLIDADSTSPGTSIIAGSTSSQRLGTLDIVATDFASDSPLAFTLGSDTIDLAQIASPIDQFTGNYLHITLPVTGGGYLARSSPEDQYVYLSLAGGDTVAVVTANPWVEILESNLAQGDTTGTGTLTIKFTSDLGGDYAIKKATGFKVGTAITGGSGTLADGESVTKTLELTGLSEGQNVISVEVTASSRTGRDAVAITGACVLTPVNFSLDFGTGKIIVQFKGLNCSNIEKYEIYYDTDGSTPFTDCSEVEGTAKSKVTVDSPSPGEKITKEIDGLENNQIYYVQIVAWDDTDQCSISGQQSILVERALTLTDLAGEDGGYDCFGISPAGRGGGRGVWMLAVPLLALGLLRLRRRWRRGW